MCLLLREKKFFLDVNLKHIAFSNSTCASNYRRLRKNHMTVAIMENLIIYTVLYALDNELICIRCVQNQYFRIVFYLEGFFQLPFFLSLNACLIWLYASVNKRSNRKRKR